MTRWEYLRCEFGFHEWRLRDGGMLTYLRVDDEEPWIPKECIRCLKRRFFKTSEPAARFKGLKGLGDLMKLLLKGESIYAIGFRNQVELRVCKKPPRAQASAYEKDGLRTHIEHYEDKLGRVRSKTFKIPYKYSLENVIHVGGKVIGVMDATAFWRITRFGIPPGQLVKLNLKQSHAIIACLKGRERNE